MVKRFRRWLEQSLMVRVLVKNNCRVRVDCRRFEKWAGDFLEKKIGGEIEISLLICGPRMAQNLNRTYRKMNYVPQVLGFPLASRADGDGWIRLGDIVICYQKLKQEVKISGKTEEMIWKKWLEHGIENLLK